MKTPATAHLLLSGLILAGLALLGPRLDRVFTHSSPAQIVVHADQTLAPVNPLLFGQDFGPWMHTTETYVAQTRWGTTQVTAESSDELLLPTFASLRDDRRLAILVVNKDPTLAREATLTVEGFQPAGQAQVWLQDEEHAGAELPAIAVAETFPYTFPPYSVTLFVLEPAPRSHWVLWAGLGLLAVTLAVLAALGRWVWRPR